MRIDIVPMGAVRMTQNDFWKPSAQRYFCFKNELKLKARIAKYELSEPLSLTFIIPMARTWTAKRKDEMNGQVHRQKPDLDNLIKAFKDALTEHDETIGEYGIMRKEWGYEGAIVVHT